MNFTDKRVAEKFAAFEQEQEPALVYEALEMVEAAERDMPAGDRAAHKRAVSRWLRFLAALDRNIDPHWAPNEVPLLGPTPPPSHGVIFPSGEVDPATIGNPVVRAEYEQALKASKDYVKRYGIQLQLRRIETRAMRVVERLLAESYTSSVGDRQEFEELLAESQVNELRREQLRTIIASKGNAGEDTPPNEITKR